VENVVELRHVDLESLREIREVVGDQRVDSCYQCAKCTSGCPVAKLLDYRPHQIMGLVRLGAIDQLIHSDLIWTCSECMKCKERCPQEVAPTDVIYALRSLAIRRGVKPLEGHLKMIRSIQSRGTMQPVTDVVTRAFKFYRRAEAGLPPVPMPKDLERFGRSLLRADYSRVLGGEEGKP